MSPGQARFAREHDARRGVAAAGVAEEIFFYHEDPWATYRWLVDDAGRAVATETFRSSPRTVPGGCTASRRPRSSAR